MKKRTLEPDFFEKSEFSPKIGRLFFEKSGRSLLRFLSTEPSKRGSKRIRTNRNRTGRGSGRRSAALRQRVTIKTRVVKMSPRKGTRTLKAHVRYLERSGAGMNTERAVFFGKDGLLLTQDVREFIGKWSCDKHHFRLIISPENGTRLDLESYARNVMAGIERDLSTSLEWFAAAHYNTDNQHFHVVMRGKDERDANLYIDKQYIKEGMRSLAEELATDVLGHRTEQDIRKSIERNLIAYRFTPLDKSLAGDASLNNGIYVVEPFRKGMSQAATQLRSDKLTRLGHLRLMELAEEVKAGEWRLPENLETVLRELGARNDIIKQIHGRLRGADYPPEIVLHAGSTAYPYPLIGEVMDRMVVDELSDKVSLLVKGEDGKTHHVPLSRYSEALGFEAQTGAVISVDLPGKRNRADEVIEPFALERGGVFDSNVFREYVQTESRAGHWKIPTGGNLDEYVERFSTRAETLAGLGILKESGQRQWSVPKDLRARIQDFESKLPTGRAHLNVEVISHLPLERQISHPGKTWIDSKIEQTLSSGHPQSFLVEDAIKRRVLLLKERGIDVRRGYSKRLYEDELQRVRARFASHGKYHELRPAKPFTGKVLAYEQLGTGYHLIAKGHDGYAIAQVHSSHRRLERDSEVVLSVKGKERRVWIDVVREPQHAPGRER